MDVGIFPPSIRLSANRIGWRLSDLEKFKASRPNARGEPLPVLWPRRERQAKAAAAPGAKPVGRPRGSRVILGPDGRRRLVLAEEMEVRDAAASRATGRIGFVRGPRANGHG
jgi:hypothetical protein